MQNMNHAVISISNQRLSTHHHHQQQQQQQQRRQQQQYDTHQRADSLRRQSFNRDISLSLPSSLRLSISASFPRLVTSLACVNPSLPGYRPPTTMTRHPPSGTRFLPPTRTSFYRSTPPDINTNKLRRPTGQQSAPINHIRVRPRRLARCRAP